MRATLCDIMRSTPCLCKYAIGVHICFLLLGNVSEQFAYLTNDTKSLFEVNPHIGQP
jgi:hypothetical protein